MSILTLFCIPVFQVVQTSKGRHAPIRIWIQHVFASLILPPSRRAPHCHYVTSQAVFFAGRAWLWSRKSALSSTSNARHWRKKAWRTFSTKPFARCYVPRWKNEGPKYVLYFERHHQAAAPDRGVRHLGFIAEGLRPPSWIGICAGFCLYFAGVLAWNPASQAHIQCVRVRVFESESECSESESEYRLKSEQKVLGQTCGFEWVCLRLSRS